jgi:hypothetical protein
VLSADAYHWLLLPLCGTAVALLAFALAFGVPSLIPWPLVLLGGAYAVRLADAHIDAWSPVYAGAFFAVAELAYWSLELRGRAQEAERLNERRAGLIVALALGAIALGGFVLAATSLRIGSGIAVDLLGVAAAVSAIALVALVARPHRA